MKDREFLIWIHERLTNVHHEDDLLYYMHKLRAIIHDIPKDQETPEDGRGKNGLKELQEVLAKKDAKIQACRPSYRFHRTHRSARKGLHDLYSHLGYLLLLSALEHQKQHQKSL